MHAYRNNHPIKAAIATVVMGLALRTFSDIVIVSSQPVFDRFRLLIGKKLKKVFLGVDEAFYAEEPDCSLERYEKRKLVFGGQFREGKNQDMLIRAFSSYIHKTGDRSAVLYLPGNGDLLERCKNLAESLGLYDQVQFPGRVDRDEMKRYYASASIALVPSNSETFGSCIAEPFILGAVVVTRPVGCAIDVIVDGDSGLIFSNEQELSRILGELLPNTERMHKVAENALKQRSIFLWDQICKSYLAVLD